MEQYRGYNRGGCNCGRNTASQNQTPRYGNNMNNNEQLFENQRNNSSCPLAMACIPSQEFNELYDAREGLCQGTMFPELNLIFCGMRGNK